MNLRVLEQPRDLTTDGRNTVSAVVELIEEGGALGLWTVSTAIEEPQMFEHKGRNYWITMRPQRFYRRLGPAHQVHARAAPRHRNSEPVREPCAAVDSQTNEDREVIISMNQPLRTLARRCQASFTNDERTSILQVVRNPGWLCPTLLVQW